MSRPENERDTARSARSLAIEAAGATTRGRRRINADAFLIDEAAGLLAVSDAIGDEPHSALMSRIALAMVREPFDLAWSQRPLAERFTSEGTARLGRGIAMANRRAYEVRATERRCKGTTFAGFVACRDHICIAHVGDSRIYLLRKATGEVAQLTEDHTVMSDMLARGMLREAAVLAQGADALTRVLGKRAAVDAWPVVVAWAPGDVVLVCTDGLSDLVHAEAIQRVLASATDLGEAVRRLVDAAEELGGWDNATGIVGRNGPSETRDACTRDSTGTGGAPPRAQRHAGASARAALPAPGREDRRDRDDGDGM
jgi:PPM family protein phosphatase